MSSTGNETTCSVIKKNGQRCKARPMKSSEFCFFHDPDQLQARKRAQSEGGKARQGRVVHVPSQDVDFNLGDELDVQKLVEMAIQDTLLLENSVARSRALFQLGNLALRLLNGDERDPEGTVIVVRREGDEVPPPEHTYVDDSPPDWEY